MICIQLFSFVESMLTIHRKRYRAASQADSLQQFKRTSAKQTIADVDRVTAENSTLGQ